MFETQIVLYKFLISYDFRIYYQDTTCIII